MQEEEVDFTSLRLGFFAFLMLFDALDTDAVSSRLFLGELDPLRFTEIGIKFATSFESEISCILGIKSLGIKSFDIGFCVLNGGCINGLKDPGGKKPGGY
jgi:hypothetical protein